MIHLPISNIYLFICSFDRLPVVHLLVVHLSTCICVRSYCCSFIFCTFAILFFVCFCTFENLISCQSVHFFLFMSVVSSLCEFFPSFSHRLILAKALSANKPKLYPRHPSFVSNGQESKLESRTSLVGSSLSP